MRKRNLNTVYYLHTLLILWGLLFAISCKNDSRKTSLNIRKEGVNQTFKFVLYPVIYDNSEFSNKLRDSLKEVIEYKFLQEVILQNYIPADTSEVQNDLNILNAKKGLICKINDLNLFFPNKIFMRCLVFTKTVEDTKVDITTKLLAVREEKPDKEKDSGYKIFDLYIDLNDKNNLQEAEEILKYSSSTKGFLIEHTFLKQENFLFVIKEKFAALSKNYLFDP